MASNMAAMAPAIINRVGAALVLFCSLLLFLDYLLPGSLEQATVLAYDVYTTRVRGGGATTYNIVTEKYTFPITDDFLTASEVGDTLRLEVTSMLKIVNAYGLNNQKTNQVYHMRYLTGLIFPLALMLVALFALRVRDPAETTLNLLIGLEAMALFIFLMTLLNISNWF